MTQRMKNIFNFFILKKEIEEDTREYKEFLRFIYFHLDRETNHNTMTYTNSGYSLGLS